MNAADVARAVCIQRYMRAASSATMHPLPPQLLRYSRASICPAWFFHHLGPLQLLCPLLPSSHFLHRVPCIPSPFSPLLFLPRAALDCTRFGAQLPTFVGQPWSHCPVSHSAKHRGGRSLCVVAKFGRSRNHRRPDHPERGPDQTFHWTLGNGPKKSGYYKRKEHLQPKSAGEKLARSKTKTSRVRPLVSPQASWSSSSSSSYSSTALAPENSQQSAADVVLVTSHHERPELHVRPLNVLAQESPIPANAFKSWPEVLASLKSSLRHRPWRPRVPPPKNVATRESPLCCHLQSPDRPDPPGASDLSAKGLLRAINCEVRDNRVASHCWWHASSCHTGLPMEAAMLQVWKCSSARGLLNPKKHFLKLLAPSTSVDEITLPGSVGPAPTLPARLVNFT